MRLNSRFVNARVFEPSKDHQPSAVIEDTFHLRQLAGLFNENFKNELLWNSPTWRKLKLRKTPKNKKRNLQNSTKQKENIREKTSAVITGDYGVKMRKWLNDNALDCPTKEFRWLGRDSVRLGTAGKVKIIRRLEEGTHHHLLLFTASLSFSFCFTFWKGPLFYWSLMYSLNNKEDCNHSRD